MRRIICQVLLVTVLLSCENKKGLDGVVMKSIESKDSIISLSKYADLIDADSLVYVPIGVNLCKVKAYQEIMDNCLECDLSNCFLWIKNSKIKAIQSYDKYGGKDLIIGISDEKNKSRINVFKKEELDSLSFEYVLVNGQYLVTIYR